MGIKGLNPAIASKAKKISSDIQWKKKVPISLFKGKKIGVDSLNWLHTNLYVSQKTLVNNTDDLNLFDEIDQDLLLKELLNSFCNFNNKFISEGVTPLWIWDGVSKNNKSKTKEERRKKKEEVQDKLNNLKKSLMEKNFFERDKKEVDEYKKLKINAFSVNFSIIEKVKIFGKQIGIPTIVAEDEAENLGSSLCNEKKISALWSTDTDTYPLECPLVINTMEWIDNKNYINVVMVEEVRRIFGMDREQFRDFCILLGTDFNERIPGVGPVACEKLINLHSDLESIEKNTIHSNVVKNFDYHEVRKQLTVYKTNIEDDFEIKSVKISEIEIFNKDKKLLYEDKIYNLMKNLKIDEIIEKNNMSLQDIMKDLSIDDEEDVKDKRFLPLEELGLTIEFLDEKNEEEKKEEK